MKKADEVLQQAVQGITDLINVPAIINLDFADVQTVMREKGVAHIGIGYGKGETKATDAVRMAVESPLLETTVNGATDVIINISGDISLADASDAASYVQEQAGEDVNIIFGAMYDDSNTDSCDVTVIATGIGSKDVISPNTIFGSSAGKSSPYGRDLKTGFGEQLRSNSASYNRPSGGTVRQKNLEIPSFLRTKR